MRNPLPESEVIPVHQMRDEPPLVDGAVEVECFGPGGKIVVYADPSCLAKRAYDPATKRTRYWLKRYREGPENGKLYNPSSPSFDGRTFSLYEFRPATADAFNAYLRFLQTANPRYVREAERMSI